MLECLCEEEIIKKEGDDDPTTDVIDSFPEESKDDPTSNSFLIDPSDLISPECLHAPSPLPNETTIGDMHSDTFNYYLQREMIY